MTDIRSGTSQNYTPYRGTAVNFCCPHIHKQITCFFINDIKFRTIVFRLRQEAQGREFSAKTQKAVRDNTHPPGNRQPSAANRCLRHAVLPSEKSFAAKTPSKNPPPKHNAPMMIPTGIRSSRAGGCVWPEPRLYPAHSKRLP